jgi:hypothetical protein
MRRWIAVLGLVAIIVVRIIPDSKILSAIIYAPLVVIAALVIIDSGILKNIPSIPKSYSRNKTFEKNLLLRFFSALVIGIVVYFYGGVLVGILSFFAGYLLLN